MKPNFLFNWWQKQIFFSLAGLKITPLAFLAVFALFFWLFASWRHLKQDYEEERIISFSLISVLVFLFFSRLGFIILNFSSFQLDLKKWLDWQSFFGFNLWFGFLSFLFFAYFFSQKHNWFFFDTLEKLTFTLVQVFFLLFLGTFFSFLMILIISLVWLMANYFKNYRSFLWYPSGKVGFLFLATFGFASLFYTLTKNFIFGLDMIELTIGLLTTGFCLFKIYLLSGRKRSKL